MGPPYDPRPRRPPMPDRCPGVAARRFGGLAAGTMIRQSHGLRGKAWWAAACVALVALIALRPGSDTDERVPGPAWTLTWRDEFEGAAGTRPDPTRWTYDLGASGWGSAELQEYTDAASNAAMDGRGNLAIVAR